jgi:hypothetical protein
MLLRVSNGHRPATHSVRTAPEVIQTLCREEKITQADAAKLGPRSPTPEKATSSGL